MLFAHRASPYALAAFGVVLLSACCGGCFTMEHRIPHEALYEHHGMWCADYAVNLGAARVAALYALTELKMPVDHEGPLRRGLFIDTRTADPFEVRLEIMPVGRYGDRTRIGVRVGGFGTHRHVCERLQDAIARQVVAVQSTPVPSLDPPLSSTPSQRP
jgi:hypothetical protein